MTEQANPCFDSLLDKYESDLFSSSKITRLNFLEKVLQLVKSSTTTDCKNEDIIGEILLQTYGRFDDSDTKDSVNKVLLTYVEKEQTYLSKFIKFVDHLSSKSELRALSDNLTLLSWISSFGMILSKNDIVDENLVGSVISAQARLSFACLNASSNGLHHKKHRKRIHDTILSNLEVSILSIFLSSPKKEDYLNIYIKNLLESIGSPDLTLLFLGSMSNAFARCEHEAPSLIFKLANDYKMQILDYYRYDVLLSKTTPSKLSLHVFGNFVNRAFEKEDLTYLLPSIDKCILRSSEAAFSSILPALISNLSLSVDLTDILLESKFCNSIFNGLKSSKQNVREGSYKCLNLILTNHFSQNSEQTYTFFEIVIKNFKATSNVDVKLLVASVLGLIKMSSFDKQTKVLDAILPLISKESNENVLQKLLSLYFNCHLSILNFQKEAAIIQKSTKILNEGLKDKRGHIKRAWFLEIGRNLLKNESFNLSIDDISSDTYSILEEAIQDAKKSALLLANNKVLVCSLISASIILSANKRSSECLTEDSINCIYEMTASTSESLTVISNSILSKTSQEEDVFWMVQFLDALAQNFEKIRNKRQYGVAWLYLSTSSNLQFKNRLLARAALEKTLYDKPSLIEEVVDSINDILLELEDPKKDDTMCYNYTLLGPVLSLITQTPKEVPAIIFQKLLIASHHKSINYKNGWIALCQRANIDIGLYIKDNEKNLLNIIFDIFEKYQYSGCFYESAVASLSTLCFIAPDIYGPHVSNFFSTRFDINMLSGIDSESIEIWRGNEGDMVIDVLSANSSKELDKNTKDYATMKWEADIRNELAAKKKNTISRKLSKEEKSLIDAQIAAESKIRSDLNQIIARIQSVLKVAQRLVKDSHQVNNGAQYWYSVIVTKILTLSNNIPVHNLVESGIEDTYLMLSNMLSSRMGNLNEFVGIATLRVNDNKFIDPRYLGEPLKDLLARVLFRIKLLADQNALDFITFCYLMPMLTKVLQISKDSLKVSNKKKVTSEFSDEDPDEENLLLVLEIISAHAELFENTLIERQTILTLLISLMSIASKAKVAKECFLALCQYISINTNEKDLEILLSNLLSPDLFVRNTILEGIDAEYDLSNELDYSNELWIAVHDNNTNCANLARTIWDDNGLSLIDTAPRELLEFSDGANSGTRLSIALSIQECVESKVATEREEYFANVLSTLISYYNSKREPPAPKTDKFGLIIKSTIKSKDPWEARSVVAITIKLLSSFFTDQAVLTFFRFLVTDQALADKEEIVLEELKEAGIELIKKHGARNIEGLIKMFEDCLDTDLEGHKNFIQIRESVVILYGALARHLKSSDHRIDIVVDRMIKTLDTPSENVQLAISKNIAPLVPLFDKKLQKYIDDLFKKLFHEPSQVKRRGAAYGIAGLVDGAGIRLLAECDIIAELEDAAEDKKNAMKRESVMFAFECLSKSLGKFFEPYVIQILPVILASFGDPAPEVREATNLTARVIMKNTTSYGVKKLIPIALSKLDDTAWRSKKGSVELLGSMAYLDPAQLSASLSSIVPEIVGVLNDTHKEVRKAADQSLKRFGEVIRNPEIQAIVPDLIRAIGEPTKFTDDALDKLMKTQFVHYIDGPSLALIIHVVHRGMRERSAGTKKKACQIVGNMAILVDSKDLKPYLATLVSELEVAMVDPVQSTRSTAARAIGSLVEKLGEDSFPDLIPGLLGTLQDETKAGDRLGSAQALAEVISGLGTSKLDELLPTILSASSSSKRYIRAGFMPLLLYLPVCFGSQFSPYLSSIIPPILTSLADTDESIRDTALRAGRLIVRNYAKKAVDLLLPELENGLSDTNYRIRLSSVELTGDLLFQVTGISGKNELSEEMNDMSSQVSKNLIEVLGKDRRDRVLALLFICRSDVTAIVRNASVDIWKALVVNTPRTVKEVLPTLTSILVRRLASADEEQRNIAASTLGETVRRVGANALAELLPSIKESFVYNDPDARQGACIALLELVKSSQDEALKQFQDSFINIIHDALADPSANVRQAAALAFNALYERLGKVVIDEILPSLLEMLDSGDSEFALSALEDIMAAKSDVVFPILIPTLTAPPIDAFKSRALASLAAVAGSSLLKRLVSIINTLLDAISDPGNVPDKEDIVKAFDKVLLSVGDDGVHVIMQHLLSLIKHEDAAKRAIVYHRLGTFFENTNLDYSIYLQDMIFQFVLSLGDKSPQVVEGTVGALAAIVKKQSKESLGSLVKSTYQALSITGVKGEPLAGFDLPRGANCILPIFSQGLMYGTSEQRQLSALGIADIIDKTSATNLRPFATTLTGPLIRVVGEKVSYDIKSAILIALTSLISKIPQFLRPFVPQLQRTFIRCLTDPTNDGLRAKAVSALGKLVEHQPRVDSLVTELITGAKATTDKGVKDSSVSCMLEVVRKAGASLSQVSKTSILGLVEDSLNDVGEGSFASYAGLLGSLSNSLSDEEASSIFKSKVLVKDLSNLTACKFSIIAINAFLREAPHHIFKDGIIDGVVDLLIDCSLSSVAYLSENSVVAIGKILLLLDETKSPYSADNCTNRKFSLHSEDISRLVYQLSKATLKTDTSTAGTRRLSLVVLRTVSFSKHDLAIKPYYDVIAPSVFSCVRDITIPIRLAAEKAYIALFCLIDDEEMLEFNAWFQGKTSICTVDGDTIVPRSIGDYTKRVASRLAGVERERINEGGDEETLFSDRIEDKAEIWSVGGTELNTSFR